jgi:hypothetical protein
MNWNQLLSVGGADTQECCFAAFGDVADLDESNGVGTFERGDATREKPLRQTSDLLGAAALPERAVGALEQSLVLGELAGVDVQVDVCGVGDVVMLRIVGIGAAIGAHHGCEGGFECFSLFA